MAEKPGSEQTVVELQRKIARSRELVARDMNGLQYELNFPLKFRKTFQRHTTVWVGAALAVGLCVALLRARTQKVYVGTGGKKMRSPNKSLLESGALLGLLKFGVTLLRPAVVGYFAKKGAEKGNRSKPSSGL